jgi:hypothetical protein
MSHFWLSFVSKAVRSEYRSRSFIFKFKIKNHFSTTQKFNKFTSLNQGCCRPLLADIRRSILTCKNWFIKLTAGQNFLKIKNFINSWPGCLKVNHHRLKLSPKDRPETWSWSSLFARRCPGPLRKETSHLDSRKRSRPCSTCRSSCCRLVFVLAPELLNFEF